MKICMLTSGHDIFDNRIYYKEILSLKKQFNEIYLVAPGEKDFVTEDGIIVKCFPKRKNWIDRFEPMNRMFKIAKEINADIYHAHEPDSFQVAVKLKKELGCKIIYDSHEYHPEGFAEHFKFGRSIIKKVIYLYEKHLGKQADAIISVNELLINKFKRYNNNVVMLPNYPVLNEIKIEKEYEKKPMFVYIGGLREDRGILKILEAIELIKDEDYKYLFIGPFETFDFEQKCKKFAKDRLRNVDIKFTGKIPHMQVFDYLKKAYAGFVLLQPTNWRYVNSEPIKIFEYMATKTAVISSNFPMFEKIIKNPDAGISVDPTNTQTIADAIKYLASNHGKAKELGENGYKKVLELYNWSVCEDRLLKLYNELYK
ncbi:glycosyltransferase family 4 protein [Thermobrachium celere]|uniref:Glycosyl transferase, group 1 n=1 Tax=Thermobrachium celere DSM 8682 TaxID=941824 RepID=R7RR12_9CLOT|nr:glycosyltransferase family 4 protein [Thermobrachium celere]CDF57738.1 glycosyl transferase, group 1 [Thermobrachium celere DSM 8682]